MIDTIVRTTDPLLDALHGIGLAPHTYQQYLQLPQDAQHRLMRVTSIQREHVVVDDGHHAQDAQLWPALRVALEAEGDILAVGDWVQVRATAPQTLWLVARLEPHSRLVRRDTGGRRQALVHNADTALLVMGLDADYNLRRLDRYIALARIAGMDPVLVLTKADACSDVPGRVAEASAHVGSSIDVCAVDGRDASCLQALAPWLRPGRTLVLLGSSGAGKSTLTNTLTAPLDGGASQATGAVRRGDGRGKHTTTTRSLHRCVNQACVIDTPGLRTLHLDASADDVAMAFDDIAALQSRCRFRDCRHAGEPGCAVQGAVPSDRLASYQKLLRQAQREQMTYLDRRELLAQWKSRGRQARSALRAKGRSD